MFPDVGPTVHPAILCDLHAQVLTRLRRPTGFPEPRMAVTTRFDWTDRRASTALRLASSRIMCAHAAVVGPEPNHPKTGVTDARAVLRLCPRHDNGMEPVRWPSPTMRVPHAARPVGTVIRRHASTPEIARSRRAVRRNARVRHGTQSSQRTARFSVHTVSITSDSMRCDSPAARKSSAIVSEF